ncbi:branched-chain amino acid ABC transporter permease [Kyrpidia spormannii]|uniref:Branched-chain amino acid ABC transporter permease n=1 Tax=Kyrpidia spormannii TaxID=2055160 RepID=A0A2K8N7X9_9BACL|nr:branched-chain amino acid ABC transporter permease [Kyrpidia spormannii]ATY85456.1 branched-chain amino acid ABC transporter permease [Kyrpidia spormannii]
MKKTLLSAIVLVAVTAALPWVLGDYGVNLATEVYIMAILAMSLGLLMGYAGLVSLGHAAFFGIGAYTVALLGPAIPSTIVLIGLSMVLAGIIAWVTGMIFIRTSRFYFLMITVAFGQLIFALIWQLKSWTGGADGHKVSAPLDFGFGEMGSPLALYAVMAVAMVIVYVFLRVFVNSPAGRIVQGVMDNENRMTALGYNVRFYKVLAYTVAGAIAGLAGSLYAYFNLFVSPELTGWMFSGQVMMMVIIGGVGTLMGPAVGAALFIILQNFISSYTERWPIILGALLVTLVLVGRGGIVHWVGLARTKIFVRQKEASLQKSSSGHLYGK